MVWFNEEYNEVISLFEKYYKSINKIYKGDYLIQRAKHFFGKISGDEKDFTIIKDEVLESLGIEIKKNRKPI